MYISLLKKHEKNSQIQGRLVLKEFKPLSPYSNAKFRVFCVRSCAAFERALARSRTLSPSERVTFVSSLLANKFANKELQMKDFFFEINESELFLCPVARALMSPSALASGRQIRADIGFTLRRMEKALGNVIPFRSGEFDSPLESAFFYKIRGKMYCETCKVWIFVFVCFFKKKIVYIFAFLAFSLFLGFFSQRQKRCKLDSLSNERSFKIQKCRFFVVGVQRQKLRNWILGGEWIGRMCTKSKLQYGSLCQFPNKGFGVFIYLFVIFIDIKTYFILLMHNIYKIL